MNVVQNLALAALSLKATQVALIPKLMSLLESAFGYAQLVLAIGMMGAGAIAGLLYFNQRALIYPANLPEGSREYVDTPAQHGMPNYDDLTLVTPDGVKLHAYLIKQSSLSEQKEACTLLYCHANAGNMGHRLPIAKVFYERFKCNVFIFSYRGYGKSEGAPSEAGIQTDSQAMLDFILKQPDIDPNKIIAFGQSIGGAVAIDLVSRNEKSFLALILENTFTRIPDLIPTVIPVAKYFTFLCSEVWPSEERIRKLERMPILFLAGAKDELIPTWMMERLFELAPTDKKELKKVADGTHNDTCIKPDYWSHLAAFWNMYIRNQKKA